jgi:predicted AlkP superfamily pyrophosphatase or phosphodiesterase
VAKETPGGSRRVHGGRNRGVHAGARDARPGLDRDRSGDILVAYAERSTLGIPHGLGDAVASHGSPWDYDRQVPILWWWPRVVPVAETEPMDTVDIAPTLAAIIGVAAPPVDGRCADLGQGCPSSPR